MIKNKNVFCSILILIFIGLGLVSCFNGESETNKVSELDKIMIESFDFEMNRSRSALPNELSYNLSFEIEFSLNQKFNVEDLVVRIATNEEAIENKKSFHFNIDYSNTEDITKSESREDYPYILLNYVIADTTTLDVEVQIRITSMDLVDDINKFIKIDCYCNSKEIVDEKHLLDDGIFKMSFSDDSLTHYEFDEFSESYKIVSVIARTDTFEVPATYKDYPVKTIGEGAFYGYSNLKSLTIPNSVTTIAEDAFEGCDNLDQVTIPAIAIPLISKKNLKEVTITNGTNIERSAFEGCSNLTSVSIANGVKSIKDEAFKDCDKLINLTLPNDLVSIGKTAFSGCRSLKSITIPDSVTTIGEDAFNGCNNIEDVSIPTLAIPNIPKEKLKEVSITSGTNIEESAFSGCRNLTSISLPDSLESIDKSAFYNCNSLINIKIPNSVTNIGDNAFSGCSSLTKIEIPNYVTSIGTSAFSGCSGLISITIPFVGANLNGTSNRHFGYIFGANNYEENAKYVPSNLKEVIITGGENIVYYAFKDCSNLVSIEIPTTITSIGSGAFSGCGSLESITIPFVGSKPNETNYTNFGFIFGANNYEENANYVPRSLKKVMITGGKSIGASAFLDCSSLESLCIPNSVISIGKDAFKGCSNLQYNEYNNGYYLGNEENPYLVLIEAKSKDISSCKINSNNKFIYDNAFKDCSNLVSIEIPTNVIGIQYEAFKGCIKLAEVYNLSSLNIVKGIEDNGYIGYYAKVVHTSLEESNLIIKSDYLFIKDKDNKYYLIQYLGVETDLVLPKDIDGNSYEINDSVFSNYQNLKSIEIPNNVTSIGESSFYNCSSLTSIVIPNSVINIGLGAFYGCNSLESMTIAFVGSDLTETENTHFGYIFGASTFEENSKYVPSSLKKVMVTDGKSIAASAFFDCKSLESLYIPNSVMGIGKDAFKGCSNLNYNEYDNGYYLGNEENPYLVLMKAKSKDISTCKINSNNRFIYDDAFLDCSNLLSIEISANVISVGSSAFYNCSSLVDVYYEGNIEKWCNIKLENVSSNPMSNASQFYLRNSNNEWKEVISIAIPNTITEIKEYQFYGFNNVTSIIIPSCVTRIEVSAFFGCSSLENMTLTSSVMSIGTSVFSDCSSLTNVYYEGSIEEWCNIKFEDIFSNPMSNASHFHIKNSNHEWEEVTSIEIPNTITEIKEYQFYGFNNVSSITLPVSVTNIRKYAFENFNSLTNVNYEGSIEEWCNIYFEYYKNSLGWEYTSNPMRYAKHFYLRNSINEWEEVTSIEIPNGVKTIEYSQFYGFNNVTSITLPASVTNIDDYAFSYCLSLESIIIPDGATRIGNYAFQGCSSLASVTMPNKDIWIGVYAFSSCKSLTSIALSDEITGILDGTFENCTRLESFSIPNKAVFISKNAFYNSGLKSIEIPNSVTTIGEQAFSECADLERVVISNNVTIIKNRAFAKCYNLKDLTIGNSVQTIESEVFDGCTAVKSITLSNGITELGYRAFGYYFINLTDVYYDGSIEDWCNGPLNGQIFFSSSNSNHFYMKSKNNYYEWEEVTSLEIPNTITEIKDYQFYGFNNVTSVTLPEGIKSILHDSFYGCHKLLSIVIPKSLKTLHMTSFDDCYRLVEVYNYSSLDLKVSGGCLWQNAKAIHTKEESSSMFQFSNDYLFIKDDYGKYHLISYEGTKSELVLPDGIYGRSYNILPYAFVDCVNLTSIVIPDSVTSIGKDAFSGCTNLEKMTIPFVGETLEETENQTLSYIFDFVPRKLKEVIVTGGNIIGDAAFGYCSSLSHIVIPDSVESIGASAFNNCKSLTSIVIPKNVTSIGASAFFECSGLTSIVIPSSVTSVGTNAFYNCNSFKEVYYNGSSTEWNNIIIENANSELTNSTIYYYSETKPSDSGNYWHYVDGIVTKW